MVESLMDFIESERGGTSKPRRPLHRRVRELILRDLAVTGTAAGERFGTETELAERFRVSRNTVRKAMAELENEGYLSRRQRVGTLVGQRPSPIASVSPDDQTAARQRVIVVLPRWNDNPEGFFASPLLHALSAPTLQPPLAVEVRHYNDSVSPADAQGAAIIAIDPSSRLALTLTDLAGQGAKVLVVDPQQMIEPSDRLVIFQHDQRAVVRNLVKRFYALGHSAVGMINHNPLQMTFTRNYMGYLDAHRELDKPIHPCGIVQVFPDEAPPRPAVERISAWICTYGAAARILGEECRRQKLSIPQQVSMVCLDDVGDAPLPEVGQRVSVVVPDHNQMAAAIHACLIDWRDERRGTLIPLAHQVIDRDTIAPPPAAEVSDLSTPKALS